METYLGIDVNIHEIGQDIQVVDQAWKYIYGLAT